MPSISLAPGSIVFHRYRGYGVLTKVNLLTGWVSARFGAESTILDLSLLDDWLTDANGQAILFRRQAPDHLPHGRLMAMVRALHRAGYEHLYLYTWPKPSGLHWRWHLFTGNRKQSAHESKLVVDSRFWVHRPLRPGWYGSSSDYIFNPTMGWGDTPGATTEELIHCLAAHDPEGLAQALGSDPEHTAWFAEVCAALLPNYAYSLGRKSATTTSLPIIGVNRSATVNTMKELPWPPGWGHGWAHRNIKPQASIKTEAAS